MHLFLQNKIKQKKSKKNQSFLLLLLGSLLMLLRYYCNEFFYRFVRTFACFVYKKMFNILLHFRSTDQIKVDLYLWFCSFYCRFFRCYSHFCSFFVQLFFLSNSMNIFIILSNPHILESRTDIYNIPFFYLKTKAKRGRRKKN